MKISFGPALPVGTAGEREYYDLTLTRFVGPDEALGRIAGTSVGELGPRECGYVLPSERSLGAVLTIAEYELTMEGGIPPQEIRRALAGIVESGTLGVEHKGKHKVFDLTEALPKEPEVESHGSRALIRIWVRIGERGSLRPEMLIATALNGVVPLRVDRKDLYSEDGEAWRRPL
jgi:radical SAM-linked protein